ncbi:thiopeptide-type bacteriocin biosynthesis protein [Haloactinospora alba]|uniref:Thiopeptide-type bacteriocin biosynthesis protein n=1 Tax=Haloactinospora alba TaxID=405555 RepID=A0A543NLH1_9ACTN|nr:thiopeptide-type bacteriocin biosynthesis protein [Haloactinospora alba]TQN32681.1 thiopeptide-type bacteriocin biosynthesis protein [Haloactinospora alba]
MQPSTWHQYMIEFTSPASAAEITARHIAPELARAHESRLLHTWWYIRKTPAWRLRYQPAHTNVTVVAELLEKLAADGCLTHWAQGIYEPETLAFGGPEAMEAAHELFHHDSRHLLTRASKHHPALGQRETTVLLFTTLLRAAGQDWAEQGDVWAKITDLRPTTHDLAPDASNTLQHAMRRLMTTNPDTLPEIVSPTWADAFHNTGQELAALARNGRLQRGLRAVLAHHFIFHANRAGLSGTDQATLARLAVNTVFHTDTD